MQVLGNTLAEIAWEKGGIYKPSIPALTIPQPKSAINVLLRCADEAGSSTCMVRFSLETPPTRHLALDSSRRRTYTLSYPPFLFRPGPRIIDAPMLDCRSTPRARLGVPRCAHRRFPVVQRVSRCSAGPPRPREMSSHTPHQPPVRPLLPGYGRGHR